MDSKEKVLRKPVFKSRPGMVTQTSLDRLYYTSRCSSLEPSLLEAVAAVGALQRTENERAIFTAVAVGAPGAIRERVTARRGLAPTYG